MAEIDPIKEALDDYAARRCYICRCQHPSFGSGRR
jgi:hypothetical protein